MQFVFNLLRIMGLYMFRALLVHPQEAPRKRNLVYCVRVMSVAHSTSILVQPTQHAPRCLKSNACEVSFRLHATHGWRRSCRKTRGAAVGGLALWTKRISNEQGKVRMEAIVTSSEVLSQTSLLRDRGKPRKTSAKAVTNHT
jgi:hypothetical protein